LVGTLAGTAAAGIYGGASRLIAAGFVVDTAIRVVVSPRFSRFLHEGRLAQLQDLYRTAAVWLVLFATPVYLVLGIFAPTVLSWLGSGFVAGSAALLILSVGSIITIMAGNIHSVLLMSGHSGWAAFNKLIVMILNVIGNIVLVPWIVIVGDVLAWTVRMMTDDIMTSRAVLSLVSSRIEPS